MAKFKITAGVAGFTGESVGVHFRDGLAEVDTYTTQGVSALSYFRSAGYGIVPMDGVEVDDAIRSATFTPDDEARQLRREIAAMEQVDDLDGLRKRHAELRDKVERREVAEADAAPAKPPKGGQLADPPEGDKVGDWRAYAVEHLGVSDAQAKTMNTQELRGLYAREKAAHDAG